MRTNSLLIAIYDENKLLSQALHHSIEHLGFPVAFSCTKKEVLYSNLKTGTLPAVILMSADADWKKTIKVMNQVKFLHGKIELIIYFGKNAGAAASEFIKAGAKWVIENCSIEGLVNYLNILCPVLPITTVSISLEDIEGYHFIMKNKKFITILKGIDDSKSNEDIGKLTGLTASTIETYKKRIREVWNCNSNEAVRKAKDYKLI
jgi:DNA-binding NarL/FixJ family response regulator